MDCDRKCHLAEYYECSNLTASKALELEVLGTDYGGTSWTTIDQARHVAKRAASDGTAEFGKTLQKLITALKRNTPELQKAFGLQDLHDEWRHNEDELALAKAGMYQRVIFVAVAT